MDKSEFEDRDLAAMRRVVETIAAPARYADNLIKALAVLAGGALLSRYVLGRLISWWHGVPYR